MVADISRIYLHGIGHFHPENELSNRFLEDLDIGTTDEWIVQRCGIRSRRTVLSLDYIRATRNAVPAAAMEAASHDNAELAVRAAALAIERAGIAPSAIGLVIAGCSAADMSSPAEACRIADRLGIDAPAFDLNSACTSFFAALYALSLMRSDKLPPFILLAVPEAMTKTVNYNERSAAVLWGDCGLAAVVSLHERSGLQILANELSSRPRDSHLVSVPRAGFFRQDGARVQKFAVRETTRALRELRTKFPTREGPYFVGHQANLRMLETVCRYCEIPAERHLTNVEQYGNTGASGAGSVLSMHWSELAQSKDIAVVGVGAGLTWSSFLLRS